MKSSLFIGNGSSMENGKIGHWENVYSVLECWREGGVSAFVKQGPRGLDTLIDLLTDKTSIPLCIIAM